MLLQRRGVYVSGIEEQDTDQEWTSIENIKLSILDYTRRRPSEGIGIRVKPSKLIHSLGYGGSPTIAQNHSTGTI